MPTGANTLLAYFHYCNKAVYPFSTECRDQDLQTLAELDDEAISFVKYTRRVVAQNSKFDADIFVLPVLACEVRRLRNANLILRLFRKGMAGIVA
jgi:hypothetical protein